MLSLTMAASPVEGAIAVSPARLEVEVGPSGAVREVHFVNRGWDEVVLNLSLGEGFHDERGATLYKEGAPGEALGQWIDVNPRQLRVPPGSSARATLRFEPVPGAVALYPVLFAELASGERLEAPPSTRLRLAVPVLVTFEATRSARSVAPRLRAVTARALPDADLLVVDVFVENSGTVHGEVGADLFALGAGGALIPGRSGPQGRAGRILPGGMRRYSAEWPLTALPRPLQIGAAVRAEGEAAASVLMSLPLVDGTPSRPAGPAAAVSGHPGVERGFSVRAHWAHPDVAAATAFVVLYDEEGGEIERWRIDGELTHREDGGVAVDYVLPFSGEGGVARAHGVGLELSEGGVNRGYAAVAAGLHGRQGDEPSQAVP